MNAARYAKAIVAVVSAGLLAIQAIIPLSTTAHGWLTVSIAVLAAVTVYVVPNRRAVAGSTGDPAPGAAAPDAGPQAR